MSYSLRLTAIVFMTFFVQSLAAQTSLRGKVIDAETKEPIFGASVHCTASGCTCLSLTNTSGAFQLFSKDSTKTFLVSFVGYQAKQIELSGAGETTIALAPVKSLLQEVVVTANREGAKRSEAPVAIAAITSKTIQDAKPTSVDQVLNKVSGVYMVNLGNEQHSMSIRQPITTKSLFLYLEDGIPIRTTGLFNHNALLEMNMAAVKSIEVIKGPSSSLYGSEAIGGVVNFVTLAPTTTPSARLSLQGNTIGYRRGDLQASYKHGNWGFVLSGYHAQKKNGFLEYSDFNKSAITARLDYEFTKKTNISHSITWLDYYSDMPGGIDSMMFVNKTFKNPQTFTYRQVNGIRFRSTLTHQWNDFSKTTASLIHRENTIEQNPAYAIKEDYRKVNNKWVGNKSVAHGEINKSNFRSYALLLQHRQQLKWKNAVIIGGLSAELSPSGYGARYIRINKDTLKNKFTSYETNDSTLTHYTTRINNYAGFINFEFNLTQKLHVVVSLRHDYFQYNFNNYLSPSAFSGSPDTINKFSAISPKVGLTYNFSRRIGIYANYSQGFVPPQVTEMYRGVKVPDLRPSFFHNYEVGGWAELIKDKLSADISVYRLNGTNEIVSVRLDDGSSENRNAGKTRHKGIELGINLSAIKDVSIRFSGACSKHHFTEFVEKGANYSGNEMNGAPHWMHNAEMWYRPSFAKGLRIGVEWQKLGSYFMDPKNTTKYGGFDVFHFRAGYQIKAFEVWMNIMNAGDNYFAYNASKSTNHSYTLAEPRNFNFGLAYNFGDLIKRN